MAIAAHATPLSVAARPDRTGGRRIGVLLQHGFTGSPNSMRAWGESLAERGYAVETPRLPGHGTTWQEMNRTRWEDWYAEVSRAFDRLLADNDAVVVGGLSMGGGLSLRLAADRPDDVAGVVLVNPAVNIDRWDVKLLPLLKHLVGGFPPIGNDIKKAGVTEQAYEKTPLRAADSMLKGYRSLRADLARITAPVLLFHSVEDHVVDPSSARIIASTVSSRDFEERPLEDSYHVATQDNDAERIFAESAEFVARVTAA
ncbi:MAG: alpha/beta fold hydrolase [Nocardioides sp.]